MTIKAILFDKDGTLIDFAGTFFEACSGIIHRLSGGDHQMVNQLADAADFDLATNSCPASSEIVSGTSLTIAELWQPILNRRSVSQLSRELDSYFDEYTLSAVTAFEFTKPTLSKLGAMGVILGVATNDSERNARRHLNRIGVEDMFSFIAGYDSGHGPKPEPGMVEAFAHQTDLSVGEVAMVGDSINDLLAGKRAGANVVAVTSGIAEDKELRPHADHVLRDISGLPNLYFNAVGG